MQPYKNKSGDSGVVAYELSPEHIDIEFKDGKRYRYNYKTPGRDHVEAMKLLAKRGSGLATYINQHVRERFALRLA
jgi:hypothetical protein